MDNLKKIRKNVEDFILEDIPNFEIRSKKDNWLMKMIGKLMFFNKSFMTGYVTTHYPYMYVPDLPWKEENHVAAIPILTHEWVHLYDRKRMGLLFNLLYASPQCFAPLVLFGFWNPWFFLFFLCFLPIPSPGRAWAEFRGYRMTIATYYWMSGYKIDIKWVVEQFVGPSYYFMWPFRGWFMRKFQKEFEKIKNDNLSREMIIMKNVIKGKK